MERFREALKSILIAVLTLSAVYLVMLTLASSSVGETGRNASLLAKLFGRGSSVAPLPPDENAGEQISGGYELPFLATVMLAEGRFTVANDREGMIRLFNAFRPVLSEAYASAVKTSEMSEEDAWRDIISKGAVFDFGADLPLWLIARDIGRVSGALDGIEARYVALVPESDSLVLYCRDKAGKITGFSTGVAALPFNDAARQFTPNSAKFAFEAGEGYENIAFDQMVGLGIPEITAYRVDNLLKRDDGSAVSRLLEAFMFNPSVVHKYTSGRGEDVYVSDTGLLTIHSDGRLVFEPQNEGLSVSELAGEGVYGEYAILAAARSLVQAAAPGGIPRYYLNRVEKTEDGVTVVFGIEAGGVKLMEDGRYNYAAVAVKDGKVVSADIRFIALVADESERYILPEKQAAGLAEKPGTRMEFSLSGKDNFYRLQRLFRYAEDGDGTS